MRWIILPVSLALMSCSSEEVTVVERVPGPPTPERLLYNDIEQNQIFGASCTFAPSGGGSGAIAIAMLDAGYIKIEGDLLRLVPMIEDQELGPPEMKFFGDKYAFVLALNAESERPHGEGGREYDANLLITATDGTRVYDSAGLAQCAA